MLYYQVFLSHDASVITESAEKSLIVYVTDETPVLNTVFLKVPLLLLFYSSSGKLLFVLFALNFLFLIP
jgi:hypothetical protein